MTFSAGTRGTCSPNDSAKRRVRQHERARGRDERLQSIERCDEQRPFVDERQELLGA